MVLQAVGVLLGLGLVACSPASPPTYADDVATVLHQNCVACHGPGGPGPIQLLTYEDARDAAPRILQVTQEGRMPPWLPARDRGMHFRDERGLDDHEIRMIREWVEAGTPRGDVALEPAPPEQSTDWGLGEPDLVLSMDTPYTVPAHGHHDYFRNFVLDLPLEEPRWVRAVELLPDNPGVLHHATVSVDATRSSRIAANADPLPGFDALMSESAARPPDGFFVGWTPGLVPSPFPDGMAWQLRPGMDVVVNAHLWPSGQEQDITLRLGLHFADAPPSREPTIVRLGAQDIDIPPGDSAYRVEDRFELPVAVLAIGAYPHAHFLADRMEVRAETPDGRTVWLMDIPEWDFHWQDAYYYRDPIELPAGTVIHMEYVYDNSAANPANPAQPPERVLWGLNSTDEMAEFWLQVATESPRDRDTLRATATRRDMEKQVEGWAFLIERDPDNPEALSGLADLASARGAWDEALALYDRALAARPGMAMAHHGRGMALEAMGRPDDAMTAFRASLEHNPADLASLIDLGRLEHQTGNVQAARARYDTALALDSTFVDTWINLGALLLDTGPMDEAEAVLRRATRLRPDSPEAQFNLAFALVRQGETQAGLEAMNRGLDLDSSRLQPVVSIAWTLATHPDPEVRHPQLSMDLALQLREITGPDPVVSDVAAAAFAAMGRWDEALELIAEALDQARTSAPALVSELESREALYSSRRAYLQSASP